jgi:hypothetical protein
MKACDGTDMQVKFPEVACMDVGYCTSQIMVLLREFAINSRKLKGVCPQIPT